MSRRTPYFAFGGGLDFVTPQVEMPDGKMIAGANYEPWINGGYRRVRGFERFDGRPAPSDSTWVKVCLADIGSYEVGDTITGDTSGATGVIAAIESNCIAVTKLSGTFQASEGIDTATTTITSVSTGEDAPTLSIEEAWRLACEEIYRADITTVPGSGDILGVWQCKAREYAIRNNVGGTAAVIHKASSSGWDDSLLDMAHYLYFDAGTAEFAVGSTLTGGTSGATGTIHKVVVHNGDWSTNDAVGYVALTGVTGTFSDDETVTDAATGSATANGASAQFALPAGGRYDFRSYNFLAGTDTYRVYAAGGQGPAFEIDENDIVTPILLDTSMGDSPDENNPYLAEVFDGRLWLAFPGGSLQRSITGDPLTFNGFLGAAEYGLGDEITGLKAIPGQSLIAYTRNQAHAFSIASGGYTKRIVAERAGAVLYSVGELSSIYAVDDSGIIDLQRSDVFGDFADATVSDPIQPYINANRERIAGVMMIRESNQYRVLFTNGEGAIMRIRPDGRVEFGIINYGIDLSCCYWCEDENGSPSYWMGGSDGHVYRAERGRNFDGTAIESFCRLPFNHQGQPAQRKRYRLAEIELEAERGVLLKVAQDLSYAGRETGSYSWEDSVIGGGGFYDLDNWDEIYWDSQVFNQARFELRGTGKNISLLFYQESATTEPFILQGCVLHYDPRRVSR